MQYVLFFMCLGLIYVCHFKDKEIKELKESLRRSDEAHKFKDDLIIKMNKRLTVINDAETFLETLGDL